jgi:hypothetical protein
MTPLAPAAAVSTLHPNSQGTHAAANATQQHQRRSQLGLEHTRVVTRGFDLLLPYSSLSAGDQIAGSAYSTCTLLTPQSQQPAYIFLLRGMLSCNLDFAGGSDGVG